MELPWSQGKPAEPQEMVPQTIWGVQPLARQFTVPTALIGFLPFCKLAIPHHTQGQAIGNTCPPGPCFITQGNQQAKGSQFGFFLQTLFTMGLISGRKLSGHLFFNRWVGQRANWICFNALICDFCGWFKLPCKPIASWGTDTHTHADMIVDSHLSCP